MKNILMLVSLLAMATLAKCQVADSTIPAFIQLWLQNPDSLRKSHIISIKKIALHGQELYYLEQAKPKKTTNIPLPYSIGYKDSAGHTVASMTIGGVIGMRVTPGYSFADFPPRQVIEIIWTAVAKEE